MRTLAAGLLPALAMSLAGLLAANASAEDLLIKAAKVYGAGGAPLAPGAVLISNGKIAKVAASIEAPAGAKTIESKDGTIIPGLIELDAGIGVDGPEAEYTSELTPSFRAAKALNFRSRAFREALAEGVTTATVFPSTENIVGGFGVAVKTAGTSAAARTVAQDVGLAVACNSDPADRNFARSRPDSIYVRQPTNRMGVNWILRSALQKAKSDPDKHPELAAALAGRHAIFATARAVTDIEQVLRLSAEYGFHPILVGGQEAYQVVDRLVETKTAVVLQGVSTSMGPGDEGTDAFWNGAGVLHKAGVKVALSGKSLLDRMRFAVRHGLPAEAGLAAVTTVPAELLKLEKRLGKVAAGFDADLLLLSGDPLSPTTTVDQTIVDGVAYPQMPK
jgi:imidazolonepropionase-like amidohydrolase